MAAPVFVLGGSQTDFSRNYAREGKTLFDAIGEADSLGSRQKARLKINPPQQCGACHR